MEWPNEIFHNEQLSVRTLLNPHGPRQAPSALRKKSLETKLEMKY